MLYLGVAVAVVIAVLLVVVIVLPNLTGSGSAAAVLTYSGALPVANGAAAGFAGGGWTPIFAAGLVTATSESFPANATALGNLTSGCTYTPQTSIASLTLPGYTGNRSLGASPAWEFGYRNAANTLAIVSVINGHGIVLATLSGFECSIYAQFFSAIPGNVIDSSRAAEAVQADAKAFLLAHPNASAELGLIGGLSFLGKGIGPEWSITYSTCALTESPTGTGAEFNATVNALTGNVLGTNMSSDVSCGGGPTTTVLSPAASVSTLAALSSSPRPEGPNDSE
ncbi:MAG TPA: hypothetical protein VJ021_01605 [Thermoplasmata archaeon]|nr:hypothetical protein [Thermoplasmata archaeon]